MHSQYARPNSFLSPMAGLRAPSVGFIGGQNVDGTCEEGTGVLGDCERVVVPGFFCDIERFRDHFSDPTWQF